MVSLQVVVDNQDDKNADVGDPDQVHQDPIYPVLEVKVLEGLHKEDCPQTGNKHSDGDEHNGIFEQNCEGQQYVECVLRTL